MKNPSLILVLFGLMLCATRADLTYHDQPLNTLSASDAESFVDDQLRDILAKKSPDQANYLNPNEFSQLAATFQPLGTTNLIACFDHIPSEAEKSYDDSTVEPAVRIKRDVLLKALSFTATEADLDALLAEYERRPLIDQVLNEHAEWDHNPKVNGFLTAKLDQVPDAYQQSIRAAGILMFLVDRSKDPGVQNKYEALIVDATTNDSSYHNSHLYADLVYCAVSRNSPAVLKHLPDILTVAAKRAKSNTDNPSEDILGDDILGDGYQYGYNYGYGGGNGRTFGSLSSLIMRNPAIVADPRTREAIIRLHESSTSTYPNNIIPAAACGSKSALVMLADMYRNPQWPSEKYESRNYLRTIGYKGPGDKVAAVAEHINQAVYNPDKCTWKIPSDNDPGPDSTSNPTPAPTPTPRPPPPPVVRSTNAAPLVPRVPPLTATVTKATRITAVTPSGGTATVPLDAGAKLILISVNNDHTATVVTDFKFQGQVPLECINLDGPNP